MNNDLGFTDSFSIFWSESSTYVFIYAAYALVVCGVVFFIELNLQKASPVGLGKLLLSNVAVAFLAVLLFAASMLVSAWYSRFLGGEVLAFCITLAITAVALYFFKAFLVDALSLGYQSPVWASIWVAAILIAPYTLFSVFMFVLGSAWSI